MDKGSSDKCNGFEDAYQIRLSKNKGGMSQFCRWKLLVPRQSKKILEVGCGVGAFATNQPPEFRHTKIFGIDISKSSIEACKKSGKYFELRAVDIEGGIPYDDGTFDVVYADQVLEHIQNPLTVIKEMVRVLKSTGSLIVIVPTPKNPFFWDDYTHVRPYTKKSLTLLAESAGLKEFRVFYYPHITHVYFIPTILKSPTLAWTIMNLIKPVFSDRREVALIGRK